MQSQLQSPRYYIFGIFLLLSLDRALWKRLVIILFSVALILFILVVARAFPGTEASFSDHRACITAPTCLSLGAVGRNYGVRQELHPILLCNTRQLNRSLFRESCQ